ncbi:uncharacterized protein LOC116199550 isoform X2 [Punica granatum]|uniref:Uncharacterized protein LOC116199550 isoform X2 n=1 Tax=Punica granatum TaxID=22663 RepID=A0A218X0S2_PUNGR|nr:uncharacterized protein LOC116199550 isoform X2 [Punica granatum]OWM78240.1 hypothetical protein CDL15_Pgr015059 [Punica granatum]
MRLKKGTRVEVLNTEEGSIGVWCTAEIISGNGRNYYVKYNLNSGSDEVKVERVPRKAIRPCPPHVQAIDDWVPGDLVEVYHNQSWRAAMIMDVNNRNNYTVRLLGYAVELCCHKLQLRIRQVWEDGKWFVLGKGTRSCSTERKRLAGSHVRNSCFSDEKNSAVPIPHVLPKEATKRKSPLTSSAVEAHHVGPQKRKVNEKDVGDWQIHPENPYLRLGRMDARKKSLGENNLLSFSRIERTGFLNTDIGGRSDSSQLRTSTTIDAESCTSSVGSCSANDSDLPCSFTDHRNPENADESSDAESSCVSKYKEKAIPRHVKENSPRRSHSSELQAYSHAIQALFASGPFSWEEETNMSNLRRSLHISDDEHLTLELLWSSSNHLADLKFTMMGR